MLVPSTAALSAVGEAMEECRLEPGISAPPGSRWMSQINRDHRQCWFLAANGGHRAQARSVASLKHRHGTYGTATVQQTSISGPQIAAAPTTGDDISGALGAPTEAQSATRSEQLSKDWSPRSVQTIAYKVEGPNPPIGLVPVVVATSSTRPSSESNFSDSNSIIFSGAALGCFFAGSILWFASRNVSFGPS
jgi:hypothetical protein